MSQVSEAMEGFFRTFESNSSRDDGNAAVSQFADVFMAAGPQGTQAVRAEDFARLVPRRKELFQSLGHKKTELVLLREQRLDARFVLATTQWKMTFVRAENIADDIVVDSVYIVDTGGPEPKIVFYLANQDLMKVLKDRGIANG